jgi:hypothetical protein
LLLCVCACVCACVRVCINLSVGRSVGPRIISSIVIFSIRNKLQTPDALTRLGDSRGHIQRGISRILLARAYLDLLAFCRPSPPDYMRVNLGVRVAGLWLSFSLHMSLVSRCHPIAIRWHVTGCSASLRSAPLMFESALGAMRLLQSLVGLNLRRRYRAPLCRVSAP